MSNVIDNKKNICQNITMIVSPLDTTRGTLPQLPKDVLKIIFSKLSFEERTRLARVSKLWLSAALDPVYGGPFNSPLERYANPHFPLYNQLVVLHKNFVKTPAALAMHVHSFAKSLLIGQGGTVQLRSYPNHDFSLMIIFKPIHHTKHDKNPLILTGIFETKGIGGTSISTFL